MAHLTISTKPIKEKEIKRDWRLFDARGKVLGRLTSEIAQCLVGKHKVNYVSYLDMGDYAVVINARDIVLTGAKKESKTYKYYSGYPGGLKEVSFSKLKQARPQEIIRHAVSGMLPKNKLRDRRLARLFVFKDEKYPFKASSQGEPYQNKFYGKKIIS